jgi:MFS family permease
VARADNHQPAGALRTGPVPAIILASYTMIVLDISIVITALPKIHTTLGFSNTALSWVQNAYLLAFGGLLLLGARAGDLVGRTPRNRAVRGTVRLAMATAGTLSTEGAKPNA